jgi:hypothetical protein
MTGNLCGSLSLGEVAEKIGVDGPDCGDDRKIGDVSGESLVAPVSLSAKEEVEVIAIAAPLDDESIVCRLV